MQTTEIKERSADIAERADELVSIVQRWPSSTKSEELARLANNLQKRAADLRKEEFQLAVVGNHSSGKSTLINALLNKNVLGVDRSPKTGVVTYVRHKNSFERVSKQKFGFTNKDKPDKTPFGVVQFKDQEEDYSEKNVKSEFKSLLQSDLVTKRIKNAGEIVIALNKATVGDIRELIDQLLSGKGPSSGGYWTKQVSTGRLKKAAESVVNNNTLEERLREWRGKIRKPPEEVSEGTKIVPLSEIDRFVSKRRDNSDKETVISEYVDQIDIFVDSKLLEDGGVLVDLPGANTADSRDAEITLDYLGGGRVDAVLLVVDFDDSAGLDSTMSELISKIQKQDRSVTERLFLAVNKIDKGFAAPEFFDRFEETYSEHYEEYISRERVFFLSAIMSLFLSDIDPVYNQDKPSSEDIIEGMDKIIEKNTNGESNTEWKDFIRALSGYAQEYSSQEREEKGSVADEGSGKAQIVKHVSTKYPTVIREASRLKNVEEEIPSLPGTNVGTHSMYNRLLKYIHETQYENKLTRLRQDAESLTEEIISRLVTVSNELEGFPESGEELSREKEIQLRDRFRDAKEKVQYYVKRVAIKAKEVFKEDGLREFEEETRNIGKIARKVTSEADLGEIKSQIEKRNPVSDEERRICERLDIGDRYRENVKQGYFAEEVLSELVDMALRITAAKLRKAVERYTRGLYSELRGLMRSDQVSFDPDASNESAWQGSLQSALEESGIVDSSMYEEYVEERILKSIRDEQLESGHHTVSRLHPDAHSNWMSIYSEFVEDNDEDTFGGNGIPPKMDRLITKNKLDESACRQVAEEILKGIANEFIEKFNNREIDLYKSLTMNTLSQETLSSKLENLLNPEEELYEKRIEELRDELEGKYESKRTNMEKKYINNNEIYEEVKDKVPRIKESLKQVGEGFTVDTKGLSESWEKVSAKYD